MHATSQSIHCSFVSDTLDPQTDTDYSDEPRPMYHDDHYSLFLLVVNFLQPKCNRSHKQPPLLLSLHMLIIRTQTADQWITRLFLVIRARTSDYFPPNICCWIKQRKYS